MKRSRQLIVESALIAGILLGLNLAGSLSISSVPLPWSNIANPISVAHQYNLAEFALYYNQSLDSLGTGQFQSVSTLLNHFSFVNYPSSIVGTATSANSEITAMNDSIPLAMLYLNQSQALINIGLYSNASALVGSGCLEATNASATLALFENSTTPKFSSEGVPVSEYSIGMGLVASEVGSIMSECTALKSALAANNGNPAARVNFVLASEETTVQTGGVVGLNGHLTLNTNGIKGEKISFYVNGTYFGNAITLTNGYFEGNFTLPFIYEPIASIWANAEANSSTGFGGAVSNTIFLKILFNQTSIVVGDPPAVLPTFNFTVNGQLSASSGRPLPDAPVKITFFNSSYFVSTDSSGGFSKALTVPSDARAGLYYIYASFAPQGVYGPSINFTSVEVVYEQLSLSLSKTGLSVSGFSTRISGEVSANGSALANSNITVISPWGTFHTISDSSGKFSTNLPVPALEFATSESILVSAKPQQPYIAATLGKTSIGILNPLEIAIPLILAGAVIYEARNLDFLKFRKEEQKQVPEETPLSEVRLSQSDLEIVGIFKRSLLLAEKKLGLYFKASSTIREIIEMVRVANTDGTDLFSKVALLTEDYLYSQRFEASVDDALEAYKELEKIWRKVEVLPS